jgi:hypothetical protein
MKNFIPLMILSLMLLGITSCDKSKKLNASEIEDLTYLREEEKLARDVYLYAYDKYGESTFLNISSSEQKHMDKVLKLLNKYDLPDPSQAERGKFNNQELQTLYNNLEIKVDSSVIEAFKVGATIEDLDISDIDDFIARAERKDILDMYDNLTCGSRNHMRAFTKELNNLNITYYVQFITQTEYDVILNNANEKCEKK